MTIAGPERRGPERPGPDYPAEWDQEPEERDDMLEDVIGYIRSQTTLDHLVDYVMRRGYYLNPDKS